MTSFQNVSAYTSATDCGQFRCGMVQQGRIKMAAELDRKGAKGGPIATAHPTDGSCVSSFIFPNFGSCEVLEHCSRSRTVYDASRAPIAHNSFSEISNTNALASLPPEELNTNMLCRHLLG